MKEPLTEAMLKAADRLYVAVGYEQPTNQQIYFKFSSEQTFHPSDSKTRPGTCLDKSDYSQNDDDHFYAAVGETNYPMDRIHAAIIRKTP